MKKLLLLLMRLMKGCIWGITILFLGWILLQTVLFASFKVPTDSMVPALLPGDNIIVNKLPMGARLLICLQLSVRNVLLSIGCLLWGA